MLIMYVLRMIFEFSKRLMLKLDGRRSDHEMDLKERERVEDAILCRFKWSLLPWSLFSRRFFASGFPCIDQMLANYPKTIANKCRELK